MQRLIMKHGENAPFAQVTDQRLALVQRWQQEIEHVIGLLTFLGYEWYLNAQFARPVFKPFAISVPNAPSSRHDLLACFDLRKEECREQIGHHVTRAEPDPGVFIHLPAEKAASIGALLPDDL